MKSKAGETDHKSAPVLDAASFGALRGSRIGRSKSDDDE